jgi:hypothetical protein
LRGRIGICDGRAIRAINTNPQMELKLKFRLILDEIIPQDCPASEGRTNQHNFDRRFLSNFDVHPTRVRVGSRRQAISPTTLPRTNRGHFSMMMTSVTLLHSQEISPIPVLHLMTKYSLFQNNPISLSQTDLFMSFKEAATRA